jgi:hypothetical protein
MYEVTVKSPGGEVLSKDVYNKILEAAMSYQVKIDTVMDKYIVSLSALQEGDCAKLIETHTKNNPLQVDFPRYPYLSSHEEFCKSFWSLWGL